MGQCSEVMLGEGDVGTGLNMGTGREKSEWLWREAFWLVEEKVLEDNNLKRQKIV